MQSITVKVGGDKYRLENIEQLRDMLISHDKSLQTRLRVARKIRQLSQHELAKIVGKSQSAISAIEAGRNKESTNIGTLAQALGVNAVWLETGKGEPFDKKPSDNIPTIRNVPIITWMSASDGVRSSDRTISTPYLASEGAYALVVENDSMAPEFNISDIVVVETESIAKTGDYVIVAKQGRHATLKQLVIDGDNVYLRALNKDYRTVIMPKDYQIKGVVKQKIKNY